MLYVSFFITFAFISDKYVKKYEKKRKFLD